MGIPRIPNIMHFYFPAFSITGLLIATTLALGTFWLLSYQASHTFIYVGGLIVFFIVLVLLLAILFKQYGQWLNKTYDQPEDEILATKGDIAELKESFKEYQQRKGKS